MLPITYTCEKKNTLTKIFHFFRSNFRNRKKERFQNKDISIEKILISVTCPKAIPERDEMKI